MKLYSSEEILNVLDSIIDIESNVRGLDYLEKICKNIHKYFELEYVIIGQAVGPECKSAETIIALHKGDKIDNFTYELQNSPCENVCKSKAVCIYENNVKEKFHKHGLIQDLSIESYVGSPLMQNKHIYGLLVLLDTKAIDFPPYYNAFISILSSRISVEIERYINDEIVVKLQKSNLELRNQNNLDPLTAIYNRKYLFSSVKSVFEVLDHAAVLFIDIDNFKSINDMFGHQVGDEVLKFFVSSISSILPAESIFSRHGGEEFIIFVPNTTKDLLKEFTQKIHALLEEQQIKDPKVTVSIGVCMKDTENNTFESLLKNSDSALYKAKSLGKNQTVFYK